MKTKKQPVGDPLEAALDQALTTISGSKRRPAGIPLAAVKSLLALSIAVQSQAGERNPRSLARTALETFGVRRR